MTRNAFAKEHLRAFINRIERLSEEREAISADIREVYAEAKATGFDTKIMRQVVRMRKLDKADYQEQQAVFDLYWCALEDGTEIPADLERRVETILTEAEARQAAH